MANVTASKLLSNPTVMAAILKVNEKDNKKFDLTRERVLMELSKGVFRDPIGLGDSNGFFVTSLKEVPPELRTIIDSFKVTQQLGEDGKPVSQKIEVKLIPKANAIDMAMKHLGAYAVDAKAVVLSMDWDSLYGRSNINDPVTKAIEQIH